MDSIGNFNELIQDVKLKNIEVYSEKIIPVPELPGVIPFSHLSAT